MGGQCWHGCLDTDLKWGRRVGKAEPQHFCVCALLGNACVLIGNSAEKKGCPRWGAKLWGSLSPSLFQTPQESHYLQFSSTNVNGKAVIICLAEAGQAWMSEGPVRVSLHLSHTLLEADSQLAITTAGPIISALQEHAPLVTPPFLSHLPFRCGSLKWFCTHKTRAHVQLLSSVH